MTNRDFINLNSYTNIGNKTKLMFAVKHVWMKSLETFHKLLVGNFKITSTSKPTQSNGNTVWRSTVVSECANLLHIFSISYKC
jgi:hypothetical protein